MNHAEDLHAIEQGKVQDENSLETLHPKHPHGFEAWVPQAGMPSDVRLRCKKSERVMGSDEKAMAELGVCRSSVVVGLVLEISVGFWSDYLAAFTHRMPVFFRRSSRRRCFASQ